MLLNKSCLCKLCYWIIDDGTAKNSAKKFTAANLLRRKDVFYRNMLTVVKSYHRVYALILKTNLTITVMYNY